MKLLILDNYDSFTYNLVHIIRGLDMGFEVHRNDKVSPEQALKFDAIILSPGPGIPSEAGNMPQIISRCASQVPILGVCLGHQAIAEYLGAKLVNMHKVYHGVKSHIRIISNTGIFEGIPENIDVGRYHSWDVDRNQLPKEITVTATSEDGSIMALSNTDQKLYGIQFHPESIMTEYGSQMIANFLKISQS